MRQMAGDKKRGPLDLEGGALLTFSRLAATSKQPDYKLVELPKDVREKMAAGGEVVLKSANEDSHAVLCTDEKTYSMRLVESSNTTLLVNCVGGPDDDVYVLNRKRKSVDVDLDGGDQDQAETELKKRRKIVATLSDVYEVRVDKPDLALVKERLMETVYAGPAAEKEGKNPYTLAQLESIVPASSSEIKAELERLVLDGTILTDQTVDRISVEPIVQSLSDDWERSEVVACIQHFCDKVEGEDAYSLNVDRALLSLARGVFASKESNRIKLTDFLSEWKKLIPDVTPDFRDQAKASLLTKNALAILDAVGQEQVVKLFDVDSMPAIPAKRMRILFGERNKWTQDELMPYVADLATPKQSVDSLLLKMTRMSQASPSAPRIYTLRP